MQEITRKFTTERNGTEYYLIIDNGHIVEAGRGKSVCRRGYDYEEFQSCWRKVMKMIADDKPEELVKIDRLIYDFEEGNYCRYLKSEVIYNLRSQMRSLQRRIEQLENS